MRHGFAIAVAALAVSAGLASAQYKSVPIDTSNVIGGTARGSSTQPGLIESTLNVITQTTTDAFNVTKDFVDRTFSRLNGNQVKGTESTTTITPLPKPSQYPAGYYKSPLYQVMPQSGARK